MTAASSHLNKDDIIRSSAHWGWIGCVPKALLEAVVFPALTVSHLHAGQYLWHKGEEALAWTGVTRGAVKLCTLLDDGRAITLTGFAGTWFGESVLLSSDKRYESDAVALHDLTMVRLPRHCFTQLCQQCPDFMQYLLQLLAERNRQLAQLLEAQHYTNSTTRVAKCLGALVISANFPFETAHHLNISQSELSDFCQVSRSRLNEALAELRSLGLIDIGYRYIHIKDMAAMRKLTDTTKPQAMPRHHTPGTMSGY